MLFFYSFICRFVPKRLVAMCIVHRMIDNGLRRTHSIAQLVRQLDRGAM